MKIFGLPLGDSGLYCIAANIFTPFCEPKIIPLVVDTGTSHTTLNPKGAYDLGTTTAVISMLSTEGALTGTGIGHYAPSPDSNHQSSNHGLLYSQPHPHMIMSSQSNTKRGEL